MSYKAHKGKFKPTNPSKYIGDANNIIYRSSWELKVMKYFDISENIINWASEEFSIKYINPFDKRFHKYYPDFIIKCKDRRGIIKTIVIEVKPHYQTIRPKTQPRKTDKYRRDIINWAINNNKWKAASIYCKDNGWDFQILTEKDLGIK